MFSFQWFHFLWVNSAWTKVKLSEKKRLFYKCVYIFSDTHENVAEKIRRETNANLLFIISLLSTSSHHRQGKNKNKTELIDDFLMIPEKRNGHNKIYYFLFFISARVPTTFFIWFIVIFSYCLQTKMFPFFSSFDGVTGEMRHNVTTIHRSVAI